MNLRMAIALTVLVGAIAMNVALSRMQNRRAITRARHRKGDR